MAKNAVVTQDELEGFDVAGFADLGIDLDAMAGAGNEDVGSDDLAIPFIRIVQPGAPELDDDGPKYIDGLSRGDIIQGLNNFIWKKDSGPEFIPVAYKRNVIEWIDRDAGGGFVAMHPMSILQDKSLYTLNDKKVPILKSDPTHQLIDTATHMIMYLSPLTQRWEPALIGMKSSHLTCSRTWNSLIQQQMLPSGRQAPRWMYRWKMTTERKEGNGNSWYIWNMARSGPIDPETFKRCLELSESFSQGDISGADGEDEIPF